MKAVVVRSTGVYSDSMAAVIRATTLGWNVVSNSYYADPLLSVNESLKSSVSSAVNLPISRRAAVLSSLIKSSY